MDNSTLAFSLKGIVPPICDAEAGDSSQRRHLPSASDYPDRIGSTTGGEFDAGLERSASSDTRGFSVQHVRSVMAELCSAIRYALDDERGVAEESLRRAARMLQETANAAPVNAPCPGGLAPWQIRKVTRHVEAHLDQTIRNDDLATLVRLNPCYFGRVFRNSFGEPPHEYVIRRRIERAQGLMLSTDASLAEIAFDCGLADQSHLSRLFRRIVGETPRNWRRARVAAK